MFSKVHFPNVLAVVNHYFPFQLITMSSRDQLPEITNGAGTLPFGYNDWKEER